MKHFLSFLRYLYDFTTKVGVFVAFLAKNLHFSLEKITFAEVVTSTNLFMGSYSNDTIDKIGNAIIYMSSRVNDLSKTKLLKLMYLLERDSIIKYNTPFFGIKFEVWQAGPVAKDIFIDLSDSPVLLREYITTHSRDGGTYIEAKREFIDDEFSDNDIEIMEHVIKAYGGKTAKQLVTLLHKSSTAWYDAAKKNGLLEAFNANRLNHSDVEVDFTHYLTGCNAERYLEVKEVMESFNALKD